jgi:transketolase
VGEDGSSHQALEDIAFFRSIPNMRIVVPCDAIEAQAAVRAAYKNPGPFYIRLGRSKVPTITAKEDFQLNKGYILEKGSDLAIIACGLMVNEALLAREKLEKKGISASVVNMHTIKPIDRELIVKLAREHKRVLVCEEHQYIGGLYSAVCEVLSSEYPTIVNSVGVKDKFGQSGSPTELMDAYELSATYIAKKAREMLR